MLPLFSAPLAGKAKPPALMMRRLRRRHEALADRPTGRLFLAVLPDPDTAERIAETARHLRISHGLTGKPLRPSQFHVTLCPVEDGLGLGPEGVAMPAFGVCFDRAESFRNGALVLRGDGTIGLDVLQQRLSDALDGEPRKARPFTPHVTLLRDGHRVPEQRIEPIEWTVREVVLMQSQAGRSMPVARWPLG
jgi:RNA 2',3'-cyclic 3'-phosphodiesterase